MAMEMFILVFWVFKWTICTALTRVTGCPTDGQLQIDLPYLDVSSGLTKWRTITAKRFQVNGEVMVISLDGDLAIGRISCLCSASASCNEEVDLLGAFRPPEAYMDQERKLDVMHAEVEYRWPQSTIYYEIEDGFSFVMEVSIRNAAWTWTQNSPMRFIESSSATHRVAVGPVTDAYCMSTLGRAGGAQLMALHRLGSCNPGRVVHEFGHALGWYHEHVRPDRDDYVEVVEENIATGYASQYEVLETAYYGAHTYDFGSVMHYPETGFSAEGADTLRPLDGRLAAFKEEYPNELPANMVGHAIGQRFLLSTLDKRMGYAYLAGCHDDPYDDGGDEAPAWALAPWGGCNPQCGAAASSRERLVECRLDGACLPDAACNASAKPVTRKSCELGPDNLEITFDEEDLWEVGGSLQNVPYYDQYDWMLWRGALPEIDDATGELFSGEVVSFDDGVPGFTITEGPLFDANTGNENGSYLWFNSWIPAIEGDQAWFESPTLGTTNDDACEITLSYFVGEGTDGRLLLQIVACDDCDQVTTVWTGTEATGEWVREAITLPSFDYQVKARFAAKRGSSKKSHIGLDYIAFSEGCIRSDLTEVEAQLANHTAGAMADPFADLDRACVAVNALGWEWTLFWYAVVAVSCAATCTAIATVCECCVRRRLLKKTVEKEGVTSLKGRKASAALQSMNARTLGAALRNEQKARIQRMGSVGSIAARDSFHSARQSFVAIAGRSAQTSFDSTSRRPSVHRNKSITTGFSRGPSASCMRYYHDAAGTGTPGRRRSVSSRREGTAATPGQRRSVSGSGAAAATPGDRRRSVSTPGGPPPGAAAARAPGTGRRRRSLSRSQGSMGGGAREGRRRSVSGRRRPSLVGRGLGSMLDFAEESGATSRVPSFLRKLFQQNRESRAVIPKDRRRQRSGNFVVGGEVHSFRLGQDLSLEEEDSPKSQTMIKPFRSTDAKATSSEDHHQHTGTGGGVSEDHSSADGGPTTPLPSLPRGDHQPPRLSEGSGHRVTLRGIAEGQEKHQSPPATPSSGRSSLQSFASYRVSYVATPLPEGARPSHFSERGVVEEAKEGTPIPVRVAPVRNQRGGIVGRRPSLMKENSINLKEEDVDQWLEI